MSSICSTGRLPVLVYFLIMALTEAQLTNPKTIPNPIIKQLIDIGNQLHGLMLEGGDTALLYDSANRSVLAAINALYGVKNVLAGEEQVL